MRITDIEIHPVTSLLETPFAFSQGWVRQRSATLIEIKTDSGISGWGEAFSQGLESPAIAAAVIKHALQPLVLDADPLQPEVLWWKMYHHTRDYGRKGSIMAAISAIDIACWDIAGQHYQQPVATLLGGRFRNTVEPYATGFYRINGQGEAERLADEALQHIDNGFHKMKVKLGFGIDDDIAVMQSIVRAIDGTSAELMIDVNHAYGRAEARSLGDALADCEVLWFEEPVVPEDLDSYCYLRESLNIPIAGGENEHSAYGFRECFTRGTFDIAQPDLCSCGGFTAARHITAMAQAFGIRINPHVWGSAIAQAASLQLIAALPTAHHSLFPVEPLLEYDTSSHPFRNELTDSPVSFTDGKVTISDAPGLGLNVNRELLKHYRVEL